MSHPSGASRHVRRSVLGAAAACPLLLGLVACSSDDGSGAGSAPRSTAPSPTTGSPTAEAPQYRTVTVDADTKRASRAAASSYLADSTRLLAAPDDDMGRNDAVSGPALQSLIVMREEYANKNYRVEGSPKIVSQQVIRRQTHPQRLVVAACLDNSAVTVVDKNGDPVATSAGPSRVMNLLTLTLRNGHWVVTRTALPDNPTC